jgi:SAM-dependent methyltransferase
MHLDVVDLRSFYYRTKLGRAAQRSLQESLRGLWPDTRGMTVVGAGFTVPMLRPFLEESRRVVSLMPARQGVMAWPPGQPNVSVLAEEAAWPLPTGIADRLLVAHALEHADNAAAFLDEVWRVLSPGGLAVFVVPSRGGIWARSDATPFGHGHPFSFSQLERQLRDHRFTPERHSGALFMPPSNRPLWLRTERVWERVGRRIGPGAMAGALFVEASKQVYARPQNGLREAKWRPLEALEELAGPAPKPVTGRG